MPERLLDLDALPFREFTDEGGLCQGVEISNLGLSDCTATVVRYARGAYVPRHGHTAPVLAVVLRGELAVDGRSVGPGSIIECAGAYGPRVAASETLLLVIQPRRSRYVEARGPARVALGTALRSEMAPLGVACAQPHVAPFQSGVGRTRAAAACEEILARRAPSAVLFVGCAGAVGEAVDVGDIVVCREVLAIERDDVTRWQADAGLVSLARRAFDGTAGLHVGAAFSSDVFVGSAALRREVGARGALCVETEGAGVAAACAAAGVPWLMLRVIVDRADDERRPEPATIEAVLRRAADGVAALVTSLAEPTGDRPSPEETR